jgi:hypothetical protein
MADEFQQYAAKEPPATVTSGDPFSQYAAGGTPGPAATAGTDPEHMKAAASTAGDIALEAGKIVTRDLARGVIGAVTFVPDIATPAANWIGSGVDKVFGIKNDPDVEMPSSYFKGFLDKAIAPPTSRAGKISEEISGALVAGALTGGAGAATRLGGRAVMRGVRMLEEKVAPLTRVTTKAAEDAHHAGYNLSPAYIGGPVSRDVQGAIGKEATHKVISQSNEVVTDRLAKLGLGLGPNEELAPQTFDRLRQEANALQEPARSLGEVKLDESGDLFLKDLANAGSRFEGAGAVEKGATDQASQLRLRIDAERGRFLRASMDAKDMVTNIRLLRQLARSNLKNYDVEKNAIGYTQKQISDALEMRLDRRAAELSKADPSKANILASFRAGREQLAKISNVQDSMTAGGHVRASDFMALKEAGVPLSGPLDTIATTAKNFSKDVQDISAQGRQGDFSVVDFLLGGTGLITGHTGVAALSIARPIAKAALGSERVQKSMISNLRPSLTQKAVRGALDKTSEAVKPLIRMTARGGLITGTESLGEPSQPYQPDLGDQGP